MAKIGIDTAGKLIEHLSRFPNDDKLLFLSYENHEDESTELKILDIQTYGGNIVNISFEKA